MSELVKTDAPSRGDWEVLCREMAALTRRMDRVEALVSGDDPSEPQPGPEKTYAEAQDKRRADRHRIEDRQK